MLRNAALILITLGMLYAPAAAQTDAIYPDVPYVPDGDPFKQVLDIYLPESGSGPYPALVIIHCNGCSKWDYEPQAAALNARGYAAVAIEFRNISPTAPLGPVEDAFCALAWLHAHGPDYDIDPARIAVLGHSLGGYPAAMLGTVDDPARFLSDCPHPALEGQWVQGSVIYAGALELPASPFAAEMLGIERETMARHLAALETISPLAWHNDASLAPDMRAFAQLFPHYWIDKDDPPFLMIHGELDNKIKPEMSQDFADLLATAGVEAELLLLPGAGHGMRIYNPVPTPEVDTALETFLDHIFEDE